MENHGEPTCLLVESEQVHTDQPQAVAQDVPHVPHLSADPSFSQHIYKVLGH